jgi:hypothetical protein
MASPRVRRLRRLARAPKAQAAAPAPVVVEEPIAQTVPKRKANNPKIRKSLNNKR